jgi:hypothetical protein
LEPAILQARDQLTKKPRAEEMPEKKQVKEDAVYQKLIKTGATITHFFKSIAQNFRSGSSTNRQEENRNSGSSNDHPGSPR